MSKAERLALFKALLRKNIDKRDAKEAALRNADPKGIPLLPRFRHLLMTVQVQLFQDLRRTKSKSLPRLNWRQACYQITLTDALCSFIFAEAKQSESSSTTQISPAPLPGIPLLFDHLIRPHILPQLQLHLRSPLIRRELEMRFTLFSRGISHFLTLKRPCQRHLKRNPQYLVRRLR